MAGLGVGGLERRAREWSVSSLYGVGEGEGVTGKSGLGEADHTVTQDSLVAKCVRCGQL